MPLDVPASHAEDVVVGTDFSSPCRGLYVGTAGNVTVDMKETGSGGVEFHNVPAGTFMPVRATQVSAATASDIIAIW